MAGLPTSNSATSLTASDAGPGNAPETYLGFAIQPNRMLVRLLEAEEGDVARLEHEDDVSILKKNGNRLLEQITSSVDGNPLKNGNPKIWKTLANWIKEANGDLAKAKRTAYRLFILQKRTGGSFISRMNDADTTQEAKKLIDDIEKHFWGNGPSFSKKTKVAAGIADHLEVILSAPRDIVCAIIANFKLECSDGDPETDTLNALSSEPFVPKHLAKRCAEHLLAYVERTTKKSISNKAVAEITWGDFAKECSGFLRDHQNAAKIISMALEPNAVEKAKIFSERPVFVQQLELIAWEETEIVGAINDFLWAVAERTAWADQAELTETTFERFEDELIDRWIQLRRVVNRQFTDDLLRGQELADRCLTEDRHLDGREVPAHFTRGSYHALADCRHPSKRIGWHPEFLELLGLTVPPGLVGS